MKTPSRLLFRVVLVIVLAGAIASVVMNQSAMARLRVEHETLLTASGEATRLAEENQSLATLRDSSQELEALREANKDLPRLRNDVRQLRRQAEDLDKLRAENQRLQAGVNAPRNPSAAAQVPPGFISRAALRDVGLATPEAAVQTLFRAVTQGDVERLAQCSTGGGSGNNPDQIRRDLVQHWGAFPGFSVTDKKILSADEVEMDLQTVIGGAILPLPFMRVNGEWKLEGDY